MSKQDRFEQKRKEMVALRNRQYRKFSIKKFNDGDDHMFRKIARCLHWLSKRFPGAYITHQELSLAVHGGTRQPLINSTKVQTVKNDLSRAKKLLQDEYGQTVDSIIGVGIRATTGSSDVCTVAVPKAARIARRGHAQVEILTTKLTSVKEVKKDIFDLKQSGDTERAEVLENSLRWTQKVKREFVNVVDPDVLEPDIQPLQIEPFVPKK